MLLGAEWAWGCVCLVLQNGEDGRGSLGKKLEQGGKDQPGRKRVKAYVGVMVR